MITSSFISDLLILFIPLMMLAHVMRQRAQGRWMLLDPLNFFWAGCLACYVFQPISHYDLYVEWYGEPLIWETLIWIAFGLFFVIAGYESRFGPMWGQRLFHFPARLSPTKLSFAGLTGIALGLTGYAYLVSSAGGLSEWLSYGRGGTNFAQISSYVAQLEQFLPVGVMLLLFHVEFHRVETMKRISVWALAALMWMWLIYIGSRSRTIVFAGTMIAAFYIPRRKNPPLWLIVPAAVALFILVSFIAVYRGQFTNLSLNLDQLDWGEVKTKILPHGDRESVSRGEEFSCVASTIQVVPSRVPFNCGYIFLEVFTRAVPRAWWPEKLYPAAESTHPLYLEADLSRSYIETGSGSFLTGPSLTFIGFYYLVGGPVALVIFGYLTGAALRMIRTIYDRTPGSEGNTIIYLYLMTLGFGEAAAMPTYWIFSVPLVLIPLAIFVHLCGDRSGAPAARRAFPVLTARSLTS